MPIFLDCKHGHIVDVDWKRVYNEDGTHHTDVGAAINVGVYTKWLAEQPMAQWAELAAIVDTLLEIRAWYWESFLPTDKSQDSKITKDHLRNACLKYVKHYAEKLNLSVSED